MANSVSDIITELPTEVPTCDVWGNIIPGRSGLNPSVVDGTGISVSRAGVGTVGVSFSNPTQFGGGGYVVLTTAEIAGNGLPCMVASDRWIDGGRTAAGYTHGVKFTTWKFQDTGGQGGNTAYVADFPDNELRVNFAAFALKNDRDMYNPEVKKLTYTDMTLWENASSFVTIVSNQNEVSPYTPAGSTAYRVLTGNSYIYSKPPIGVGTSPHPDRCYVANFYMAAGNTAFVDVLFGTLSDGSSRYFLKLNLVGSTGTAVGGSISGPAIHSVTSNTGNDNTITVTDAGGGWREVTMTHRPVVNTTSNIYLYVTASEGLSLGATPDPASKYFYMGGVQIEPGRTPTPYLELTNSAPVLGQQESKIRLVPVNSGFGLTGATYSSHMPNLLSKKSATAYGTIVICPSLYTTGGPDDPSFAYLENEYNVESVTVFPGMGNGTEYEIKFAEPMENSNYCVILSSENEPEAVSAGATDWSVTEEFGMNVVNCGSIYRELKTVDGFRVLSFRQESSSGRFTYGGLINQVRKGLRNKIHFMVFGGGTYGQP